MSTYALGTYLYRQHPSGMILNILTHWRKYKKSRAVKQFYRQWIGPGDLCFDIGANRGDRTAALMHLGAHVIALEPQDSCVTHLQKRFQDNSLVTILPYAAGETAGKQELMLCTETDQCASLSHEFTKEYSSRSNLHWEKSATVEVVTLDHVIVQFGQPKFIKIDVEGYEPSVLKGLNSPVDMIMFEFNRPLLHQTRQCLQILAQLGDYEVNFIQYEQTNLMLEHWMPIAGFEKNIDQIIPEAVLTGEIIVRNL